MLIPCDGPTQSMMNYLTPNHSPSNSNLVVMKNWLPSWSVGSASPNFTSKASENKDVHSPRMSKAVQQRQVDILDKITPAWQHDLDIGATVPKVDSGPCRKPQSQEILVSPPRNGGKTLSLNYRRLAKTSPEELFQAKGQVLSQISGDNSIYVSPYHKSKGIVCEPKMPNRAAPNILLDVLSDKQLGEYLQQHVFHKNARCSSCKESPSAHIKCYMHKKGSIRQTVEYVRPTGKKDKNICTWTVCRKCKAVDGVVMYDTDLEGPFGIFLERNLLISAADNSVTSCGHSLLDLDCCFGFNRLDGMVAVFHFSPLVNLCVSLHKPEHNSRAQTISLRAAVSKVVLKLDIRDDKTKVKAMKAVAVLSGVHSVMMDMKDKKMTVTGEIDAVLVCRKLRKLCDTVIVSVSSTKEPEKTKEEPKKEDLEKSDDKKKDEPPEEMLPLHERSEVQTSGNSIPFQDDKMSSVISRALTFKNDEDDDQDLHCISGIHNAVGGTIKSSPHQKVSFKTENKEFTVIMKFPADFEALRLKLGIKHIDFSCSLSASSEFRTGGGKSGACFEESQDRKYLTKDVRNHEVKFFDKHGPVYFKCIGDLSMIVTILGIYQINIKELNGGRSRWMNLVVMYNLCAESGKNAMNIFDLKGNGRNRFNAPDKKVLLDQNFLISQHTNPIRFTSDVMSKFGAELCKSVEFLQLIGAVDYSLLIIEDSVTKEKVVGIIDYLGSYTLNKFCETWSKKIYDLLHFESKTWPTVVHPIHYSERFLENILSYFPVLPHSSNAEFHNLSDATP